MQEINKMNIGLRKKGLFSGLSNLSMERVCI
jgi:hypothetical protein